MFYSDMPRIAVMKALPFDALAFSVSRDAAAATAATCPNEAFFSVFKVDPKLFGMNKR